MATDSECVDYARECARLASMTSNPELREELLQMARHWMAEAMGENKIVFPRDDFPIGSA